MMGGEIPFAGHPSLGTAVAVARARGEAQAHLRPADPGRASRRSTSARRAARERSMLQEPSSSGRSSIPTRSWALVGLDGSEADAELPLPGRLHRRPPGRRLRRATQRRCATCSPDYDRIAGCSADHGALALYLAAVDRRRARPTPARSWLGGDGRGPRDRLGGRPAVAHVHARTGASALRGRPGRRDGPPQRAGAPVEGDRVRVGGDVVVVAGGTVTVWTPDRFRGSRGIGSRLCRSASSGQPGHRTGGPGGPPQTLPDETPPDAYGVLSLLPRGAPSQRPAFGRRAA